MGATASAKKRKREKVDPLHSAAEIRHLAATVTAADVAAKQAYPEWQKYLQDRTEPKPVARILKATSSPVLWGAALHQLPAGEGREFVERLHDVAPSIPLSIDADEVELWCGRSASAPASVELGVEAVALAGALPALANQLPLEVWQRLLDTLVQLARESSASSQLDSVWTSQLLGGELPLTLAFHLPELLECRELSADSAAFVSRSVEVLLDGSGLLEASQLEWARPLLASWLRCATMVAGIRKVKLTKAAKENIDWLVRHVLRLTRRDGSQALGPSGDYEDQLAELIRAAVRWSKDSADKALAKLVLHEREIATSRLPDDPGYESEWAGVAVLQPDWSPTEPRLVVLFRDDVFAELSVGGMPLLLGPWSQSISVDGNPLEVRRQWDSVCWYTDYDTDYLELETDLSGGWKLQRQFLMARQDYFLYVADIVLGPANVEPSVTIDYELNLPLADGTTFVPAEDTHEGLLKFKGRSTALVLPLALPEWRCDPRAGQLSVVESQLRLQQSSRGPRLCVPLFFDLHRRRHLQSATWRRLTVAEDLQSVDPSTAVGYRIHVGPEQWLSYRSLGRLGNRTLLGQNLASEFYLGRFLHDGDAETIVEIE